MSVEKKPARVRVRLKQSTIEWESVKKLALVQIGKWCPKASKFGYERSDLINEALIAFLDARRSYSIDRGTKFSTHFVNVLYNHLCSLFVCWYDKDRQDVVGASMGIDESGEFSEHVVTLPCVKGVPVKEHSSFAYRLRNEAPELVVKALEYMQTTSQEELIRLGFQGKGKHGFKNNSVFCRILGYDPSEVNIMDEIKKFIIQAE